MKMNGSIIIQFTSIQYINYLKEYKFFFLKLQDPVEEMELGSPPVLPPPKNYREYNNVKSSNKLLILTLN